MSKAKKNNDLDQVIEQIKKKTKDPNAIMRLGDGKKIKDMMLDGKQPKRTRCYMCDGICEYAKICFSTEE